MNRQTRVSRIIDDHGTADILKSFYCRTGSSFEVPTPYIAHHFCFPCRAEIKAEDESEREWDGGFMPAFIRVHA